MKYIVCILCVWVLSLPLQAQSYNDVVEQAMDCVKKDSLVQAERLKHKIANMEDAGLLCSSHYNNYKILGGKI